MYIREDQPDLPEGEDPQLVLIDKEGNNDRWEVAISFCEDDDALR